MRLGFVLSRYEKLYEKLDNNKNDVLWAELDKLLKHHGFILQANNSTHKVYVHELLIEQITIVVKSNKVKLPIYVDKALKAINKVTLD